MRKAQRTDLFREIKKSKGRYLSLLFIVALGTAFYAGVRSSEPDMTASVDRYYDETDFMDLRVMGTLGLTKDDVKVIADTEGILEAEGGYSTELFAVCEADQPVIRVLSSCEKMNRMTIEEGRMPQAANECFMDAGFMAAQDYRIGDTVTVVDEDGKASSDLVTDTYTIVGSGTWSWYLSWSRGSASIGDGSLDAFMIVPPEAFDMDCYTVIYALADGVRDLNTFSDAYDDAMEKITDRLEEISGERCQIRYAEVREKAESELADARKKVLDAQTELDDAKKKLTDGETDYEDGQKQYADAQRQYEKGQKSYQDGKKKLEASRKELDSGWNEYKDGKTAYDAAEKKIQDSKKQLTDGEKQIQSARAKLNTAQKEINTQKKTLDQKSTQVKEGLSACKKGEAKLTSAESQLRQKEKELAAGQAAYEEGVAQYESGKQQLEEAAGQLEEGRQKIEEAQGELNQLQEQMEEVKAAYGEDSAIYQQLYEQWEQGNSQLEEQKAVLEKSQAEYDRSAAELKKSKEKLDQSAASLAAGKKQISAGKKELQSKKKELAAQKEQLKKAQSQIKSGYTQIASAEKELKSGKEKLQTKEVALKKGQKELADGQKKLSASKKQLTDAKKKLDQGETSYSDGMKKLKNSAKQLKDAKAELSDAKKELVDARKELDDGWKDYEDALKEAEPELADARQKISDGEADLAELEKGKWYILDRDTVQTSVEYGMDAERIGAIGKVFPVIFFLVAALVSLTTMTRMIEEERTLIGTMKALGYSKFSIAAKYIFYALSATLAGGIFGVLFGSWLLPYVIMTAYNMLYSNTGYLLMPLHAEHCLVSIALALLCTVGAAFAACYKELMSTPAALMRPPAPKQGKRVFLERIPVIWKHLNFSMKSTVRNLVRYKKRFFMTVFGIGGCMSLLLVSFGLHDSIAEIVNNQYKKIWTYSASCNIEEGVSLEEQEKLIDTIQQEKEEIESGMLARRVSMDASTEKAEKTVYFYVVEDVDKMGAYLDLHDRITDEAYELTDDGVIITEKIANTLGVKAGDTITLKLDDTTWQDVTVTAVAENYLYHYVYLTPAFYQKLYGEKLKYNELFLKWKEGTDEQTQEELAEYLLKQEAVTSVSLVSERQATVDDMMNALNMVVWVLVISAGLLVFVVLFNLNNINISERRRELASLKVLGFYDMEVAMYVYRENVFLTIFGIIAGVFMGTWLHKYMILTLEVDMMMFGRNINGLSYVYSIVFTIAFAVIVNLGMYYKLKQIDMVESLKSVE